MLGVLCLIGCPVQLIREVILRLQFFVVVDTHLPHFDALAYVLAHFDLPTHVVFRVSSAFIFQRFAEVLYSVFVWLNLRQAHIDLCLPNLRKPSSFGSLLLNFTLD